jgi:phosphoglycerol transferase
MEMHAKQDHGGTLDCDRKGLLRYAIADWKWLGFGVIFSFEFASVLLLGWPDGLIPSIRLPYVFAGDALLSQWLAQRAIDGWVLTNPRSGFPFGSSLYDYPNSDSGSFLIYKLLGNLTHSVYSAVDLYFLLGFPVIFAVAFVVLRSFGIRKVYSAMSALLFTFAPFHLSRLFYGHDLYTLYFGIPLFFYYGRNLFLHGQTHWELKKPARIVGFVLIVAALSSFSVYYAFFGIIVLVVCGIAGSGRTGKFRPFVNAALFCGAIVIGVVLNLLPNIVYRETHSANPEVAARVPMESEIFALKTVHLLLPQPYHRIEAFGAFARKYDATFPLSNTTSSLGIVGTVGFLSIILAAGAALAGRRVGQHLAFASIVVLALLLTSTVGGFNVLFALFVSPLIRGWDRVSIFIDFGALLAVALMLERAKWIDGDDYAWILRPFFAAAVITTIGLWDQTPVSYRDAVDTAFKKASADEGFVRKIEASMPKGAAIYQLPYIAFPESAPLNHLVVYQLGTAFYNSEDLRWSFGGMAGRQGDLFYRALAEETVEKQLDVVRRLGFSGIYIDRRGYADHGTKIVAEFASALADEKPVEGDDGNVVFLKIPEHAALPPEGLTDEQLMTRAGYFADEFGVRSNVTMADGIDFSSSARVPYFVASLTGLSVAEVAGRWSDANLARSVVIRFKDNLPNLFMLDVSGVPFGPNAGKNLKIRIGSTQKEIPMSTAFDIKVPIDLNGQKVSEIEMTPPAPTSPLELGIGADARMLGVSLKVLKIIPQQ